MEVQSSRVFLVGGFLWIGWYDQNFSIGWGLSWSFCKYKWSKTLKFSVVLQCKGSWSWALFVGGETNWECFPEDDQHRGVKHDRLHFMKVLKLPRNHTSNPEVSLIEAAQIGINRQGLLKRFSWYLLNNQTFHILHTFPTCLICWRWRRCTFYIGLFKNCQPNEWVRCWHWT